MAHVSAEKKAAVKEFTKLISEYPIIGLVNVQTLPSPQLNTMRKSLRPEGVVIKMTKKRVIKRILSECEAAKPGISKLIDELVGMPAILFAKDNPFKLYKKIQSKKSKAPAKAGQLAPYDIVIPAGPTPFAPGPVISELAQLKIKAGIVEGKVAIKENATVAKKGDIITAPLASMLSRLSIFPMEIGLDVVSVYEAGTIYGKEVLAVDEKEYITRLTTAHSEAFNLAVECAVLNKDTTEFLLGRAANDAKALAVEQAILSKEVIDEILAKATAQAQSIQSLTN